jgi:hypothetical protein
MLCVAKLTSFANCGFGQKMHSYYRPVIIGEFGPGIASFRGVIIPFFHAAPVRRATRDCGCGNIPQPKRENLSVTTCHGSGSVGGEPAL